MWSLFRYVCSITYKQILYFTHQIPRVASICALLGIRRFSRQLVGAVGPEVKLIQVIVEILKHKPQICPEICQAMCPDLTYAPARVGGKPGVLKEDLFGHLKYWNRAKAEFEHSPSRFLVGFHVLLNSSLVDTWCAGYHGEKSNWGCQSSQYVWRLWFYFLSWHRVSWLHNELLSLIPFYLVI